MYSSQVIVLIYTSFSTQELKMKWLKKFQTKNDTSSKVTLWLCKYAIIATVRVIIQKDKFSSGN